MFALLLFTGCNFFLWVRWVLAKEIFNFSSLPRKLDNPYCHSCYCGLKIQIWQNYPNPWLFFFRKRKKNVHIKPMHITPRRSAIHLVMINKSKNTGRSLDDRHTTTRSAEISSSARRSPTRPRRTFAPSSPASSRGPGRRLTTGSIWRCQEKSGGLRAAASPLTNSAWDPGKTSRNLTQVLSWTHQTLNQDVILSAITTLETWTK